MNTKQKKKKKSDPDAKDLNPEIVEFAQKSGILRSSFNLFLGGVLTWQETLELMLIALYKDHRENKILLNKYIQRKSGITTPKECLQIPIPKKPQTLQLYDVENVQMEPLF